MQREVEAAGHNFGSCGENINNPRLGPAGVGVAERRREGQRTKRKGGRGDEMSWVRGTKEDSEETETRI